MINQNNIQTSKKITNLNMSSYMVPNLTCTTNIIQTNPTKTQLGIVRVFLIGKQFLKAGQA